MAPKSFELKISTCKDLKAFNFFQKLCVYATVSLASPPDGKKTTHRYQLQKTPVDRKGDGNPEWNHQISFDFKDFSSSYISTLILEFDFLCEALFGDKTIGLVRIPIKELLDDFIGGAVRFVSYQVVTTDGKPNGVLDFSYKVIDDEPGNVFYPVVEMQSNEFQPLVYPPPVTSQAYYPPIEDPYYSPVETGYYPPPPPPPPPQPLASVYSPPPTPYGADYRCPGCLYPTVDPFQPYSNDTWRRDSQSWNVSQMR